MNIKLKGSGGQSQDLPAFRIGPIRPPSEAGSLLLQVTNGCTWNRCKFCTVYRDTSFRAFSADSVKRDIDAIRFYADLIETYRRPDGSWDVDGMNQKLDSITDEDARQCFYTTATWLLNGGETVFLQDGNTTALSSGRLSDVLIYLKEAFPQIRRITSYGRAENLARHDGEYFAELKAAGLDRIHSGFESGSDAVLQLINKGTTQAQQIAAGRAVKAGGIELSVYFMPGVGGKALSQENAEETARVINAIDPDFLRVRTAAVKPGTDLYEDYMEGHFQLCSDDDKVGEIRRVIELADGISTRIVSDHMVNLLQDIQGRMIADRGRLLARIDGYLNLPQAHRRVFQLLRRTLRAYDLEDLASLSPMQLDALASQVLADSPAVWAEKMNQYIGRYI